VFYCAAQINHSHQPTDIYTSSPPSPRKASPPTAHTKSCRINLRRNCNTGRQSWDCVGVKLADTGKQRRPRLEWWCWETVVKRGAITRHRKSAARHTRQTDRADRTNHVGWYHPCRLASPPVMPAWRPTAKVATFVLRKVANDTRKSSQTACRPAFKIFQECGCYYIHLCSPQG